jgi:signal transduction histidine kinase
MVTKASPTPFDQKLFFVFIVTFASMTAFEFVGQIIYLIPPVWRSNIITILFTSGLAVIIAYFPLKSFYDKNVQLFMEMERRQQVEKELRESEAVVRRANRQLNLLSGITRHDINNQLTALNLPVDLLRMKISDPALQDCLSQITEASNRIAAMIRFTKIFEEIGAHAAVWQDLRTLVNSAGTDAVPGQVTLKDDLPGGLEVFADPLILKVFFNLIDNALRHGVRVTTIRFSFIAGNEGGIIVCEDDGEGVAADEKERMFDRGFGKNTGFGLAISREILSITGMAIKETGEPGKGARFEITVPKGAWRFAASRNVSS